MSLHQLLQEPALIEQVGTTAGGSVQLGSPRVHYESLDTDTNLSCCLDWRATIQLRALSAGDGPSIVVGRVDFLVLQLGDEPAAEILEAYGDRAAAFSELFEGAYLESALENDEEFTAGHIGAVLILLDATVGQRVADTPLRAWALSHIVKTMLPTIAGLVVMNTAASGPSGTPVRRLMSADRIDPDWALIGCTSVPGYHQFFGQSTAFTYLEDARTVLDAVRSNTFTIPLKSTTRVAQRAGFPAVAPQCRITAHPFSRCAARGARPAGRDFASSARVHSHGHVRGCVGTAGTTNLCSCTDSAGLDPGWHSTTWIVLHKSGFMDKSLLSMSYEFPCYVTYSDSWSRYS